MLVYISFALMITHLFGLAFSLILHSLCISLLMHSLHTAWFEMLHRVLRIRQGSPEAQLRPHAE